MRIWNYQQLITEEFCPPSDVMINQVQEAAQEAAREDGINPDLLVRLADRPLSEYGLRGESVFLVWEARVPDESDELHVVMDIEREEGWS